MKVRCCIGYAVVACLLAPSVVEADPVDNDGDATFTFYDGAGPFLNFASSEVAYSNTASGGPSEFFAFIDSTGETFFSGHDMGFHETDLAISSDIHVQLWITDVIGFVDCSTTGPGFCEVDWEISAQLRFKNVGAGGITTNNCRTAEFQMTIQGDWGDIESDPVTFPALSGAGTGACNTWASTINNFFDLGTGGASMVLYKFEGTEDASGLPLEGS